MNVDSKMDDLHEKHYHKVWYLGIKKGNAKVVNYGTVTRKTEDGSSEGRQVVSWGGRHLGQCV